MTEWSKKRIVVVCLLCVLGGWMASSLTAPDKPRERPVLKWISRAARTALLFFFFSEPPPQDQSAVQHPMADGTLPVDHGRAI